MRYLQMSMPRLQACCMLIATRSRAIAANRGCELLYLYLSAAGSNQGIPTVAEFVAPE